jgi:hypothetical protein
MEGERRTESRGQKAEGRRQKAESREQEAARMLGVFLEMGEGSTWWELLEEEARESLGRGVAE